MSDNDLLALAAIIAREDEYRSKGGPDEYKAAWYADMEQAMAGAGVLSNGELSALGTVKLDDILLNIQSVHAALVG